MVGIYPGTLISRRADGGIEYAASFFAGKRQLNMNIIAIERGRLSSGGTYLNPSCDKTNDVFF
jgi:hypothetical protein